MDEPDDQELGLSEPELDAMDQVEIPFLNDILLAVMANDGEVYVPVVPFCEHLGLGSPKHQVRYIRADEDLNEALRLIPIETQGGMQKLQCLRVDMLALWLTHIRSTMVNENARPALKRYKKEAARAILNHFLTKAAAQKASQEVSNRERLPLPSPSAGLDEWITYYDGMAALYRTVQQQNTVITIHEQRLDRHDEEIAALSEGFIGIKEALAIIGEMNTEPRISIHQQNQLQDLVSKIHDATGLHQGTIFAAFKKQWQIPRYDELPAAQFDVAYEWLRQWGRARWAKKTTTSQPPLLPADDTP